MAKLSKFDFQYLIEAAKAFERQVEDVTAYPDAIESDQLVVVHKNLMKKYQLKSLDNDYQTWIDDFKLKLAESEKTSSMFERE